MWWLFLLLLLVAVLLIPFVWAMVRVSKLRFSDSDSQVVAPEDVPEEVITRLKSQVEPLVTSCGFEYLGMMKEIRGGMVNWQAFLISDGDIVWAVAEESDQVSGGRRVNMLSFRDDGSVVITRDGDEVFGEEVPGVVLHSHSFSSALAQAESHVAFLLSEDAAIVPVEPEALLLRYKKIASQGLDSLFERGWLHESERQVLKVPFAKLPRVAIAWGQHLFQSHRRRKQGSSWLLDKNLGKNLAPLAQDESSQEEEEVAMMEDSKEEGGALVGDFPVEGVGASIAEVATDKLAAETVSGIVGEFDGDPSVLTAVNESGAMVSAVEAMPVGPFDKKEEEELPQVSEASELAQEAVKVAEAPEAAVEVAEVKELEGFQEVQEEAVELPQPLSDEQTLDSGVELESVLAEESVETIPEEDGLSRDWALYQRSSSKKSWVYWLGGFGGRALLVLSLLAFFGWMAVSNDWGLRIVLLGAIALLLHELGHALLMLVFRSWDWSQFLIPMPRPMSAKQWSITGGFKELLTILAGPLPGLLVGWLILIRAYLGVQTNDLFLDIALALVVVNSITLLPFLPLDGGRLLDLAVLRKMPQLRVLGLFVAGLAFFVFSFFGGGVIAIVLALLMWFGVPASLRKSKLLPWLRSNVKEDEEEQVVTAYSVAREQAKRKSFKGVMGIARFDELMGLGAARKLGFFGALLALLVLAFSWVTPVVLPSYHLASAGQEWYGEHEKVKQKAKEYLGELRPEKKSNSTNLRKEDTLADLEVWRKRMSKNPSEVEKVLANEFDLNAVRVVDWRVTAHWIAKSPIERQIVAREAARTLRREAIRSADSGNSGQAFRDLSIALRIIIECEPRHSLEQWVSWFELEREILKEIEDVSSRYPLEDGVVKWYEAALARCPRPSTQKVAGLILAESQSPESLVGNLKWNQLFSTPEKKGLGRRFLASMEGFGTFLPKEALQERQRLAEVFAQSTSLSEASQRLAAAGRLSVEMEDGLQRIGSNYSFRQIAISALKVKRVGIGGAAQELAKLRKDYGFTARLDEAGSRKALKLKRLSPTGELIEMEWLLQQ